MEMFDFFGDTVSRGIRGGIENERHPLGAWDGAGRPRDVVSAGGNGTGLATDRRL